MDADSYPEAGESPTTPKDTPRFGSKHQRITPILHQPIQKYSYTSLSAGTILMTDRNKRALFRAAIQDPTLEISHLCPHKNCCEPSHFCAEDSYTNKTRWGCPVIIFINHWEYSCCTHDPKCIPSPKTRIKRTLLHCVAIVFSLLLALCISVMLSLSLSPSMLLARLFFKRGPTIS